jgi:hypothetical protein
MKDARSVHTLIGGGQVSAVVGPDRNGVADTVRGPGIQQLRVRDVVAPSTGEHLPRGPSRDEQLSRQHWILPAQRTGVSQLQGSNDLRVEHLGSRVKVAGRRGGTPGRSVTHDKECNSVCDLGEFDSQFGALVRTQRVSDSLTKSPTLPADPVEQPGTDRERQWQTGRAGTRTAQRNLHWRAVRDEGAPSGLVVAPRHIVDANDHDNDRFGGQQLIQGVVTSRAQVVQLGRGTGSERRKERWRMRTHRGGDQHVPNAIGPKGNR